MYICVYIHIYINESKPLTYMCERVHVHVHVQMHVHVNIRVRILLCVCVCVCVCVCIICQFAWKSTGKTWRSPCRRRDGNFDGRLSPRFSCGSCYSYTTSHGHMKESWLHKWDIVHINESWVHKRDIVCVNETLYAQMRHCTHKWVIVRANESLYAQMRHCTHTWDIVRIKEWWGHVCIWRGTVCANRMHKLPRVFHASWPHERVVAA